MYCVRHDYVNIHRGLMQSYRCSVFDVHDIRAPNNQNSFHCWLICWLFSRFSFFVLLLSIKKRSKGQRCGQWRWSASVWWPSLSVWSCLACSSGASGLGKSSMRSSSFPQRWAVWSTSSLPLHRSTWNIIAVLTNRKLCMIFLCVAVKFVVIMAPDAKTSHFTSLHSP